MKSAPRFIKFWIPLMVALAGSDQTILQTLSSLQAGCFPLLLERILKYQMKITESSTKASGYWWMLQGGTLLSGFCSTCTLLSRYLTWKTCHKTSISGAIIHKTLKIYCTILSVITWTYSDQKSYDSDSHMKGLKC